MKTLRINADEVLWRNNMLPEGILERWLVADGAVAREGHAVAQVRIEGALHDIVAPATGRFAISAPKLAVIEPGFLLATRRRSRCGSLIMPVLGFIVSLLLDVRAHIPNQPSFGSGPSDTSYGTPPVRAIATFLITTTFLATMVWLAVRLVMEFL